MTTKQDLDIKLTNLTIQANGLRESAFIAEGRKDHKAAAELWACFNRTVGLIRTAEAEAARA